MFLHSCRRSLRWTLGEIFVHIWDDLSRFHLSEWIYCVLYWDLHMMWDCPPKGGQLTHPAGMKPWGLGQMLEWFPSKASVLPFQFPGGMLLGGHFHSRVHFHQWYPAKLEPQEYNYFFQYKGNVNLALDMLMQKCFSEIAWHPEFDLASQIAGKIYFQTKNVKYI